MLPAQECLEATDPARRKINQWLIEQGELLLRQCIAEVQLKALPLLQAPLHIGRKESPGFTTVFLGTV
jgi:hypothetical protein